MSNYVLPYRDLIRIAVLATSRDTLGRVEWQRAAKQAVRTLLEQNIATVCERYPDIEPEKAVSSFNVDTTEKSYLVQADSQINSILSDNRNNPLTTIFAARAVKSISDYVNNSTAYSDELGNGAHLMAMTAGFVAATVLAK